MRPELERGRRGLVQFTAWMQGHPLISVPHVADAMAATIAVANPFTSRFHTRKGGRRGR